MIPSKLVPGRNFDVSARTRNQFINSTREIYKDYLTDKPNLDKIGPVNGVQIAVRNIGSATFNMFDVMALYPAAGFSKWCSDTDAGYKLDDCNVTRFKSRVYMEGAEPNVDTYSRFRTPRCGICIEPIGPGKIGIVQITGIVQCRVLMRYKKHQYALTTNTKDYLVSSHSGIANIIWNDLGPGGYAVDNDEVWALVCLGQPSLFRRFEMSNALVCPQHGHNTVEVSELDWVDYGTDAADNLTDHDGAATEYQGTTFKVTDTLRMHSKMATQDAGDPENMDVGAYGIAWWPHDKPVGNHLSLGGEYSGDAAWEILTMQIPGPFFGIVTEGSGFDTTDSPISVAATDISGQGGHRTLSGYDPFGAGWAAVNGSYGTPPDPKIDVSNQLGFAGEQDDLVFCMWNIRDNQYYIIAKEAVEQTVVTGLSPMTTKDVGVLWSK